MTQTALCTRQHPDGSPNAQDSIRRPVTFHNHILAHIFEIVNTPFPFSFKKLYEHFSTFCLFCTKAQRDFSNYDEEIRSRKHFPFCISGNDRQSRHDLPALDMCNWCCQSVVCCASCSFRSTLRVSPLRYSLSFTVSKITLCLCAKQTKR